MGIGIVAVGFDRLSIAADRLIDARPRSPCRDAKAVDRPRSIRLDPNRHAKLLFRFFDPAVGGQGVAVEPVGREVLRRAFESYEPRAFRCLPERGLPSLRSRSEPLTPMPNRRRTPSGDTGTNGTNPPPPRPRQQPGPICGRYVKRSAITSAPNGIRPITGSIIPRYHSHPTSRYGHLRLQRPSCRGNGRPEAGRRRRGSKPADRVPDADTASPNLSDRKVIEIDDVRKQRIADAPQQRLRLVQCDLLCPSRHPASRRSPMRTAGVFSQ